jgi:hypothetical protein
MIVKGELALEIDEQGLLVTITITPGDAGGDISPESIRAAITEKKVRSPVDTDAIDRAFRTLARGKGEPVTFVAAAGTPPQPGMPERVAFEEHPIPARLAAVARAVLASAPQPRGFRLREERVKREKKVLRKSALPFLPSRETVEMVVEKRMVREDVDIDPAVTSTGYVDKGAIVARVTAATRGREGKSVFGRLVPAPLPESAGFLFCAGLSRAGTEVTASAAGFLRRGAGWCDVVPFTDHLWDLTASPDGLTCLLSFTPGDRSAPMPDAAEIVLRAQSIGFEPAALLPAEEIRSLLAQAAARGSALAKHPIVPVIDGAAVVTVSMDKLKATMFLRKGRGGGKPLTNGAVSEAIRSSKVKGFDPETVRKDLLAFFAGKAAELADYPLAVGKPAVPGSEPRIEWRAMFLPEDEASALRAAAAARREGLATLASLAAFPLEKVESVARVTTGREVLRITPSVGGTPGIDAYGVSVSPARAPAQEVRLFEGVAMRKDTVVTTDTGILEKGSDGMAVLLRVRPHRDAELRVALSPDRMKASLSFSPPLGDGARITANEVRSRVTKAGVQKGIGEERMLAALDKVARGEAFADVPLAEGRRPVLDAEKRVVFHTHVATGRALTLRADGRADFRAQDRITRVRKGELIATVRPRDPQSEDGWDVTGMVLPPPPGAQEALRAATGVREELVADGSTKFFADATGELVRDGVAISVMDAHSVGGDVDMSTGNINFPGHVRIGGSVRSGFTVTAAGLLEVGASVEAALLSAEGSISVGQGIKGEGKAILRSKRAIEALFAEQAVLLAMEDVHLRGPCVRCQVKTNGRLLLDSEKGALVGGEVRASRGAVVQTIGSPGGTRTVVSFGQDFLVKDQIEREEREVAALTASVADMDRQMLVLGKRVGQIPAGPAAGQSRDAAALARLRAQKLQAMKLLEQRKMRLITLRDKYDEHVDSEVLIRGTLYPGAVLESHGRRFETRTEKKMITLHFDPRQARIVEKP